MFKKWRKKLVSNYTPDGFQDPATSVMEGMLNLHHDIMFICIFIVTFVGFLIFRVVKLFN
jgi:heme/copper-type cytochrome/quinol oxidase subunit 2